MMGHDWPYWAFLVGQSCATGATTGYLCSRYVMRKADEREAWLQAELDKDRLWLAGALNRRICTCASAEDSP